MTRLAIAAIAAAFAAAPALGRRPGRSNAP
jgi:hypothetical protein